MARKDTNINHPETISVCSEGPRETRPARSRDLFTDPYSFRTGLDSPAITALTFDLWNTLYAADGGYDTVRPRRVRALRQILAAGGAHPSEDEMQQTFRSGFDAYMEAWTAGRHYGARDQVLHFLGRFEVDPAVLGEEAIGRAVHEIEDASQSASLELLPGVRDTIPALAAAGYRLGIISDTSLTPGRILREFLAADGLLDCFSALTFSDETGYPKPDRRMFESTLAQLGAEPRRAAHVGDTPRTDIAGAKAVGMVAIRCAGAADHEEPPEADFVIRDHREIAAILERLG
ncbi:MAG: HAD family hydrolase [Thermoleophilia bacterium]|nr:HAD family hydrolase [Thermoleophilia bacterium]